MNVQDVMTKAPRTCRSGDSLVNAAKVLWDNDCGAVPVVDDGGRPVGMVTDRDCCMAAYTRGRRLDEITVGTAMATVLFTVRADEAVQSALALMQQRQVRRLPVVDAQGRLCGIVSLADVARSGRAAPAAVAEAFGAITSRRAPVAAADGKREPTAVVVPKAPAAPLPPAAQSAGGAAATAGKAKGSGKTK